MADIRDLGFEIEELLRPYQEQDEYGTSELHWTGRYWIEDGLDFEKKLEQLIKEKQIEARIDEQKNTGIIDECLVWIGDRKYDPFGMPQYDRIAELEGEK